MGANSAEKRSEKSSASEASEASDRNSNSQTGSMGQSQSSTTDGRTPRSAFNPRPTSMGQSQSSTTDGRTPKSAFDPRSESGATSDTVHRCGSDGPCEACSKESDSGSESHHSGDRTRHTKHIRRRGGYAHKQEASSTDHYLSRTPSDREDIGDGDRSSGTSRRTGPTVQRRCASCGSLDADALGMPVQPKLDVGSQDSPVEREADRIARTIMTMDSPNEAVNRHVTHGTSIQRYSTGGRYPTGGSLRGQTETVVRQAVSGPGTSLGSRMPDIKRKAEAVTGTPMDGVTVHEGQQVDRACKEIGAVGFTKGTDVALASRADDETAAHELGHVAQQRAGGISRQAAEIHRQFMPVEERPGYEPSDRDTSDTDQQDRSSTDQQRDSSTPDRDQHSGPETGQSGRDQRSESETDSGPDPTLEGPAWDRPGTYDVVIRGGIEGVTRGKTVPKPTTLEAIARDNDIHMRALQLYNGLPERKLGSPGKVIYIPRDESVIERLYVEVARRFAHLLETTTYRRETNSQDGVLGIGGAEPETLGDVAQKTGVPLDVIATLNGITEENRHSPPEVLDIPVGLTIGDGHDQSHGVAGAKEMMSPGITEKASVEGPPWNPPGEWDFVDRGRTERQQNQQTLGTIARHHDIHWRALQLYNGIENANDPPRIVYIPQDEGVIAGLYVKMIDEFDDIQTITIDRGQQSLSDLASRTKQSANISVPWPAIQRLNDIQNPHAPDKDRLKIIVDATKPTPDLAPQETDSRPNSLRSPGERGATGIPIEPPTTVEGDTSDQRDTYPDPTDPADRDRLEYPEGGPYGASGAPAGAPGGYNHKSKEELRESRERRQERGDQMRAFLEGTFENSPKIAKLAKQGFFDCGNGRHRGKVPIGEPPQVDEEACNHCETFEDVPHDTLCDFVKGATVTFGTLVIASQTWPIVAGSVATTVLLQGPCGLLLKEGQLKYAEQRDEKLEDIQVYNCEFLSVDIEVCSSPDGYEFTVEPSEGESSFKCYERNFGGPEEVVVERGDTLSEIAANYEGRSVEEIAKHNDIDDPSSVHPGMTVEIPDTVPKDTEEMEVPNQKQTPAWDDPGAYDVFERTGEHETAGLAEVADAQNAVDGIHWRAIQLYNGISEPHAPGKEKLFIPKDRDVIRELYVEVARRFPEDISTTAVKRDVEDQPTLAHFATDNGVHWKILQILNDIPDENLDSPPTEIQVPTNLTETGRKDLAKLGDAARKPVDMIGKLMKLLTPETERTKDAPSQSVQPHRTQPYSSGEWRQTGEPEVTFENLDAKKACNALEFIDTWANATILAAIAARKTVRKDIAKGDPVTLKRLQNIEKGATPPAMGAIALRLAGCEMAMTAVDSNFSEMGNEEFEDDPTRVTCELEQFDLKVRNTTDSVEATLIPHEGGYTCEEYYGPEDPATDENSDRKADGASDSEAVLDHLEKLGVPEKTLEQIRNDDTDSVSCWSFNLPVSSACTGLQWLIDSAVIGLFITPGAAKPAAVAFSGADAMVCQALVSFAEGETAKWVEKGGLGEEGTRLYKAIPASGNDSDPELDCSFREGPTVRLCKGPDVGVENEIAVEITDLNCRPYSREPATEQIETYDVRRGDDLRTIATEYGVDAEKIYQRNEKKIERERKSYGYKYIIHPGTTLEIPMGYGR